MSAYLSIYLSIYLSCVCFNCICCFNCSYSILTRVCLFVSLNSPLSSTTKLMHSLSTSLSPWCPPSKCNWTTTSAATRTRFDNGNGNANHDTQIIQQLNAEWQQSLSIINIMVLLLLLLMTSNMILLAYKHVGCHPHPAWPFNNTDVWTLERGDVPTDNGGEGEGGHCAGNGLDREHVDIVNIDRRPVNDVPPPNTSKDNKSTTATTTKTRTNNCNRNGNHNTSQATWPACWTTETIQ